MVLSDASRMDMNLNLKVRGGKRIPVRVPCKPTVASTKTMIFANREHISDSYVSQYIEFDINE